ncbi:hypothetical protein JZO70_20430 [Enterococcus sp. 669A]|uniref:Alternate signal-mediated exported protein n=1 Tax=Candidatus Enterococcus moelleringii TaxID=2815325 RepID=A0ABS3LHM5_9ENTE|nr:BsaA family SipW-dependent biofilm matrix protein [Enterococcus sp. 669A]MBO1308553.1 hypothetical protein [Enterococcus sp. 669A]
MNQKEKRRHLFRVFVKSKLLFACFSLVLSLLLVLGSTYAWVTKADERVNRSPKNKTIVSARIEEDFHTVTRWAPGTTRIKAVRVKNDGTTKAIVRLSFKEFFVGFDVDITDNHRLDDTIVNGNGNLKVHELDDATDTLIKVDDVSTWEVGNKYQEDASTFYLADTVFKNETYKYSNRPNNVLASFQLDFHPTKFFDQLPTNETNYWFYHNGYFYYSEILEPNEVTEDLLKSVTLSPAYANEYKGALYKLVPEMDAHDISESVLTDWSIKGTDAEKLYKDKLHYMNKTSEGGTG